MAAETGSGKTGAFCLPVLQIVWETLKDLESGKTGNMSSGHNQHCMLSFHNCRKMFYLLIFIIVIIIYSCTLVIKFI